MSNTKVMVTGGAGFIGSHVVDKLLQLGYGVVVVDNFSSGNRNNVNRALPDASVYNVDIKSPSLENIFKLERPDLVCHLAAQISVQSSMKNPVGDANSNILGSINVMENCVRYGVKKVIYSSSGGAIYGEPTYLPCDEYHPINPLSNYGVSKYTVEKYLQVYKENFDLNYTILRLSNVYGPRQDPYGEAGVAAIFSMGMIEDKDLVINGAGDQERDFLFIVDLVQAIAKALDRADGEIVNLGNGVGYSINKVYSILKEQSGYVKNAQNGPAKPGEVFKIYLDVSKAQDVLGWRPTVSIEAGLKLTLDWFKNK